MLPSFQQTDPKTKAMECSHSNYKDLCNNSNELEFTVMITTTNTWVHTTWSNKKDYYYKFVSLFFNNKSRQKSLQEETSLTDVLYLFTIIIYNYEVVWINCHFHDKHNRVVTVQSIPEHQSTRTPEHQNTRVPRSCLSDRMTLTYKHTKSCPPCLLSILTSVRERVLSSNTIRTRL
jgi:hypothetical protein